MRRLLSFVLILAASFASAQTGGFRTVGIGAPTDAGTLLPSCSASSILYTDSSKLLQCNPATVVNGSVSTAGRSILTIQDTISGSSATSNFLNITGAFPATLSAQTNGLYFTFALDNDAQIQEGLQLNLTGTGSTQPSYGILSNNQASGTTGVAVYGTNSGSQTVRYGGLFTFAGANPSATSAALAANNANVAADIFRAEDSGIAVFTIADGGATSLTSTLSINGGNIDLGANGAGQAALLNMTALTPDSGAILTGTTSNAIAIAQRSGSAFDFNNGPCGTSACTYPQIVTHTETQDTTQFIGYSAVGASGGSLKTLTESSATTVFGCPAAALHSLGCEVRYRVEACDATDCQTRSGRNFISGTNKAGTMTCAVAAANETADGSIYVSSTGAGTLTYAATATTGTAECIFNLNAVASLTQTSFFVQYQVNNLGPGQVTRK